MSAAPVPPSPAWFDGFQQSLQRREISFPNCQRCGKSHWYPMPRCPHCQSEDLQWLPVDGEPSLYAYTIVRHGFSPDHPPPYVIGLIDFPECPGIRLVSNIIEATEEELAIGMAVEPVFFNDQTQSLVRFRPAHPQQRPKWN